ncbi:peptide synthetase [Amycolatopsis acidicola]|uniref:Peptide synthetase n=1 Tax=Amycolatopsis acidicola TaxID=2596893 RepID=A0A5N0V260_9PSEU|nr:peptide synthetase [Amycolatopsis acidicola]KAA9158726.1 peptide synthetase [Amycolatopsis acidicola]
MSPDSFDLTSLPALTDANDVVKAFAANPAFRAAEWEELTTEDDPWRRPVRPDDLEWLDYSKPMPAHKKLKLSALLGHRMLRNVYDAGNVHLPPRSTEVNATSAKQFHSETSRVLGALAKPILERHLFTLLEEQRPELSTVDVKTITETVRGYHEQRVARPGELFDVALRTRGRKEAATFVLLQLSAFRPAAHTAIGRAAIGEYDTAHPALRGLLLDDYRAWVDASAAYRELLSAASLVPTAGAYWQLYLGTSLGRGNLLQHYASDPSKVFELAGAYVHEKIDRAATGKRFTEVFADGFGYSGNFFGPDTGLSSAGLDELLGKLLPPLAENFGTDALAAFHRGFSDARWFAETWDADLATQLDWADKIEEYQEKAEKIDQHLTNENIEVDLDTFVETNEETSTTHVHNEHRLVMIETGQMHFWNNVTHKIQLNEGDKLLIPVSRLHGSTVLSGSCTYHQPIIPDEMLQQLL